MQNVEKLKLAKFIFKKPLKFSKFPNCHPLKLPLVKINSPHRIMEAATRFNRRYFPCNSTLMLSCHGGANDSGENLKNRCEKLKLF
jgi:hypothetical protein